MTVVEAGCTPMPGAETTELLPPSVPPEGGWCYIVQTVDGRYAYAAAITTAVQHHEDLYFGDTPTDAILPPMLYLSCDYIPLMPWGWLEDNIGDPDTHAATISSITSCHE